MSTAFLPLEELRKVRDLDAQAPDKAVLMCLILRTNNATGYAFPGYPTIASDAGVSLSTAKRRVRELEKAGHLTVERHRLEGSRESDVNRYRVHVVSGGYDVVSEGHDPSVSETRPSYQADTTGGVRVTPDLPLRSAQVSAHGTDPLVLTADVPTAPRKSKAKREASPDHRDLVAYYVALYEKARGCKPDIAAKDRVGANRLLGNGRTLAEAKAILDRAFADEFIAGKRPDLATIASAVNGLQGRAPAKAGVQSVPVEGRGWKVGT